MVTVPLRALGSAGVYTAGYRVVSADGHPVSGSITFTLRAPGTATAPAATATAEEAPPPGAAVLLGVGLTVVLRIGNRP